MSEGIGHWARQLPLTVLSQLFALSLPLASPISRNIRRLLLPALHHPARSTEPRAVPLAQTPVVRENSYPLGFLRIPASTALHREGETVTTRSRFYAVRKASHLAPQPGRPCPPLRRREPRVGEPRPSMADSAHPTACTTSDGMRPESPPPTAAPATPRETYGYTRPRQPSPPGSLSTTRPR